MPPRQFLTIDDFSPGIVSDTRSSAIRQLTGKPGIAQELNTHRCVALVTGGLGPLPTYTTISLPTPVSPVNNDTFVVNGLDVIGQVFSSTAGRTSTALLQDELHVGIEWAASGSTNASFAWYRIRLHDLATAQIKLLNTTQPSAPLFTTPFFTTKTRLRSPTSIANVSIAASWEDQAGGHKRLWFWPSNVDPTLLAPIETTGRSGQVVAHSGAVVMVEFKTATHYNSTLLSNEYISFTAPPLSTIMGDQGMVFNPADLSGFGAVVSLGAQLMFVRSQSGIVFVNGDLSVPNPEVMTVPTVHGTGMVVQEAVGLGSAVFFCNEDDVCAWDGTQTVRVTPQMRDGFFLRSDPIANTVYAPRLNNYKHLSFVAWGDYLLFPNNFLFVDKAWWRVEDPATKNFAMFAASQQSGIAYASVGSYATGGAAQIAALNKRTPATSYSWQSHPIPVTQTRWVDVREIEIVAMAEAGTTSTVTVTLTSLGGGTQAETFTLTQSDQPMRLRKPTSIQGYNVIVRIEAASNQAGVGAPVVYSVTLGYHETHTSGAA